MYEIFLIKLIVGIRESINFNKAIFFRAWKKMNIKLAFFFNLFD